LEVIIDPERTEIRILHEFADIRGKDVVEVGCGDGRLTWRYAQPARSVLALDPDEARMREACEQMPEMLTPIVTFQAATVQSADLPSQRFDVAIL
jgi:2-polyprenyl-3-methyl-5-hydroxy-6-metoxy-1,4-benzoquinol methylase